MLLNRHKEQTFPQMGFRSGPHRGKSTACSKKQSKSRVSCRILYWGDRWQDGGDSLPQLIHLLWPQKLPAKHLHSPYMVRTPHLDSLYERRQSTLNEMDWFITMKINGWRLDFTSQTPYSEARVVHITGADPVPPLLNISFDLILFTEMSADKAHFPILGLF